MTHALALLLLAGCAQPAYWVKDSLPVKVRLIVQSKHFPPGCVPERDWGCADRATGIIYISPDTPPSAIDCVLAHERFHMEQGMSHADRAMPFGELSCGETGTWSN